MFFNTFKILKSTLKFSFQANRKWKTHRFLSTLFHFLFTHQYSCRVRRYSFLNILIICNWFRHGLDWLFGKWQPHTPSLSFSFIHPITLEWFFRFSTFLKVFDKHIATHLNIDSELLWIYIQLRRQYEVLITFFPFTW